MGNSCILLVLLAAETVETVSVKPSEQLVVPDLDAASLAPSLCHFQIFY